ncbi:MAG: NADH-quinone oxidoreductase subunit F [Natronomonas sp.]|jgi:NADH-quinone oxidoreductase subunit F
MSNAANSPDENGGMRLITCAGTGCVSSGSLDVHEALADRIADLEDEDVDVALQGSETDADAAVPTVGGADAHVSGCHGFCEQGPLVRIEPEGILYTGVTTEDVDDIVERTVRDGEILEDLCYHSPDNGIYTREEDIPFYRGQRRIVLSNCGRIDPECIEDYEDEGGYDALDRALTEMDPDEVWGAVKDAGLRGRGGAGFPTGLKWEFAADQDADEKYVVANCDEGDPGAFMDRSLVEGDPHRLVEGMAIAGYATGASNGIVFIRAEYPLAVERIQGAIEDAREAGYLGGDLFGQGFDFDLEVKKGAGAFVSGEETALIKSIEGKRGMPDPRPPYPVESGLWGQPTTINNVETLGNVPEIIRHGADWFADIGSEDSPGTKTFAVTGDVQNTGLIEVPMGITLREAIYDVAGGVVGDEFKAVQIGGPSGGCLAEQHLDMPMTFDSLQEAGAMIGSGGLVVMDESTCMVEVARYFLSFTQEESCGKCPPCRVGTKRMLEILEKFTSGEATEEDLERLEELSEYVADSSLCGLGKTAPTPVDTTLRYFRDEYEAHLAGECPAGECALGESAGGSSETGEASEPMEGVQ